MTAQDPKAAKVCGAFAFTVLLALLFAYLFDFYYDLNDDTMIKDILSGAYTGRPSGFCIQMLYPLGWCIALLYKAIPAVPWYGLFLCLCQFGVFFFDRGEAAVSHETHMDADCGAHCRDGACIWIVSAAVCDHTVQRHRRHLYGGCGLFVSDGARDGQAICFFQGEICCP